MAGTIVADDLQHSTAGSVGTEYVVNGSAKSWMNYVAISVNTVADSLNVSSVTDHGTGQYSQNFSSNMGNATYAATMCSHQEQAGVGSLGHPSAGSFSNASDGRNGMTTSAFRMRYHNVDPATREQELCLQVIFGDLA
jgi:hypothetical protein